MKYLSWKKKRIYDIYILLVLHFTYGCRKRIPHRLGNFLIWKIMKSRGIWKLFNKHGEKIFLKNPSKDEENQQNVFWNFSIKSLRSLEKSKKKNKLSKKVGNFIFLYQNIKKWKPLKNFLKRIFFILLIFKKLSKSWKLIKWKKKLFLCKFDNFAFFCHGFLLKTVPKKVKTVEKSFENQSIIGKVC